MSSFYQQDLESSREVNCTELHSCALGCTLGQGRQKLFSAGPCWHELADINAHWFGETHCRLDPGTRNSGILMRRHPQPLAQPWSLACPESAFSGGFMSWPLKQPPGRGGTIVLWQGDEPDPLSFCSLLTYRKASPGRIRQLIGPVVFCSVSWFVIYFQMDQRHSSMTRFCLLISEEVLFCNQ